MTYGRLIEQAKQLLTRSLAGPVVLPETADALALCDARARLYRVLAGGLALHLDPPREAPDRQLVEYRGEGIMRREATLLDHLRADLLRCAGAADTWQSPAITSTTGTAARLARAADAAGAAFDLLAGHLFPPASARPPNSDPLRRGGTRVTARDAVQLTRAMAHLDSKLELPIRSLVRPDLEEHSLHRLVATADDCKRVSQQGVHEFATAIHQILRAPSRHLVDDLDLAAPATTRQATPAQPTAAAELVAELRRLAHRRPERLSITDLAAVASVGARVCALTAYACTPHGGPAGAALATARQWRAVSQHLAPFTTPSQGRDLATYAHRFRGWSDPLIRHGHQAEFTHPSWLPAIEAMTSDLAKVAQSVTRAITNKISAGELLVPFDPGTRGREHLYAAAKSSDDRVVHLRRSAADTNRSAEDLARVVQDIDPSTRPRPPRRAVTPKPTPTHRGTAPSRATPPPAPQPQPPTHPRRRR